jgi:HD-GYP domain-containing protein (c-di-GMP phosphodiesterase class II)/putative methionine-R-sulfoxide reductase with GAF domain
MSSIRGTFALRVGFSAATAILILAGASLNVHGRSGQAALIAVAAGLLALGAGAMNVRWRISAPLAAAALIGSLVAAQFDLHDSQLPLELGGLLLLGVGGLVGSLSYNNFTNALRGQLDEMEGLVARLEEKNRAFLAATSDAEATKPGDIDALTTGIAGQMGAAFAVCYMVSADGKQFVPQPPGFGLDRLRPQSVNRAGASSALLGAIEAGKKFVGADKSSLVALMSYVPTDLTVDSLLAVPMRIGDHIGGFILLGNKVGGFTDDDVRLATTLMLRAGAQLASAHAVALSQQEAARYSVMNQLVKEAAGKTMAEVLDLVLVSGTQLIAYDAGRIALFQPDDTYVFAGAPFAPSPIAGPMAKVRGGETVLRTLVTVEEGIFSGLQPAADGGTANEALVPIRAQHGVLGAICLGRSSSSVFTQRDVATLDELGSLAGVAVENSRVLQAVTGQATKLDTALDALGEVSQALTTVTEGARVLEQKTLETAVRVTGGSAGLLTRSTAEANQAVRWSLGFPAEVNALEFQNGQGIVGAVMLGGRATAVADLSSSADLMSPPDLAAYGLQAAICVPMLEDGRLWGTLSVFDVKKREWTTDDQRVLATLGNQGVVAVRNAELYDNNQRIIWELKNLLEALKEATATLDVKQVLPQVLAGAAKASSAQIGCLALADSGRLVLKGAFGTDSTTAERLALGLGGDICRDVMASGTPFMEAMKTETQTESPLNPRAVLCVPITLRDKPTGVLFLANYQVGHAFTDDHRNLVTELARLAGVAIENAQLFQDREVLILKVLEVLAKTLDERDPYTAGHSERVTQYALMIARQMKYSPKDQGAWDRLERGVRFHDIGKVKVPDAVMQKPGKLTDAEFDLMKQHTTVGHQILSGLKMLTDELVIVRSHHERYDGKGYPDRLKGDQLPIFAWIASAADAIDAMTSDRPYRRGMPLSVAVDQVRNGAGTHFHPDVAEAVLDAVNNGTLKVIAQKSMYADAPAAGAFENPTG